MNTRHRVPDAEQDSVRVTEFGGVRVAYDPERDDAWISGWIEVPR